MPNLVFLTYPSTWISDKVQTVVFSISGFLQVMNNIDIKLGPLYNLAKKNDDIKYFDDGFMSANHKFIAVFLIHRQYLLPIFNVFVNM